MRFVALSLAFAVACGAEGPTGPAGEDGADGVNGLDGADGTDNRLEASIFCTGLLENTVLYFTYHAAVTTAGDIFASGSVYGTVQMIGASAYFAAGQVGAATAPVFFTADVAGTANGGWWQLSLNRTTLVTSIMYNDADVAGGQTIWAMAAGSCTVYDAP